MENKSSNDSITISEATNKLRQFVAERDWEQFHTPRNLLMALVGQVGELAEIFQWKGEVSQNLPQLNQDERKHVGEEIADIFAYLVRFSDVCGIDLSTSFAKKMQKNGRKYPKEMVKGSAKKYTEYKHNWQERQKHDEDNNEK